MRNFLVKLGVYANFVLCVCLSFCLFCHTHKAGSVCAQGFDNETLEACASDLAGDFGREQMVVSAGNFKQMEKTNFSNGQVAVGAGDLAQNTDLKAKQTPIMAIIIDDFGGYDRNGVEQMLNVDAPLTCAVIPFADNTKLDAELAEKAGKEVILHLPMASHVRLPQDWYGKVYIDNNDGAEAVKTKIDRCLSEVPHAKGANIHIGSGACQNERLMSEVIGQLNAKGLFFCDSRTHEGTKCARSAEACGVAYLGRDVFLEPHGLGGYSNACHFLKEGAKIALEKGYSIAIGHVGSEGGVSTAKAIADTLAEIRAMGVEIVPLSQINARLSRNV